MADTMKDAQAPVKDEQEEQEMCCDNSGRTAEQHRKEAEDGKCCID